MKLPVEITTRNLEPSEAVEVFVRAMVSRLERTTGDLLRCTVIIERADRQDRGARLHHVRIYLTLPGCEIVVGRDPEQVQADEDVFVAITDAFRAALREVMDRARVRRAQVKAHADRLAGD